MKTKRFTGMKKTRRDNLVKRFKQMHPDATNTEIAQRFQVTPAIIGKILNKEE